jgi:glycosyltransferase involved in cell wall biosynthesis
VAKKQAFLTSAKVMRLYDDVLWQATSVLEKQQIQRVFPAAPITVAPNLAGRSQACLERQQSHSKPPGRLDVVFLSRIEPKKNLHYALTVMRELRGDTGFDIYGPCEDAQYWAACQRLIHDLPTNVTVTYRGALAHDQVENSLSGYDLFLLPTLGENYGHVIREALCAGCPVLISDQTPWRGLSALGIGWDAPLDHPEEFRRILQQCVDMGEEEHCQLSDRARAYGLAVSQDTDAVEQNRLLFQLALQGKARP